MNKTEGQIVISGFHHPLITFNIESSFWYLLRIYQQEKLIYQYIGLESTHKIDLHHISYGQSELEDDSDLHYSIIELKEFSYVTVDVFVSEIEGDAQPLINHGNINDMKDKRIEGNRFYKGDLHAHTFLSDGSLSPEALVNHAHEAGLDFFFITDHNFFHNVWPNSDLLVLPGVEFTGMTGHWNALNISEPVDMYSEHYNIESIEGTHRLMDKMKSEGTLVSVNHPFLTIWSWLHDALDLSKVDTLELWNDPSYKDNPAATEEALIFWHKSLMTGHRIAAVGGSDFHHLIDVKDNNRTNALNDPTTHVYCEGLNKNHLLNSLKSGHVFVTRFIDVEAMEVTIDGQHVMFGDTMQQSKQSVSVIFNITGQHVEADVYVYTKDQKIVLPLSNNTVSFDVTLLDADFIRFELRTEELIAFTNPVYKGIIPKTTSTFKEVKEVIYEL